MSEGQNFGLRHKQKRFLITTPKQQPELRDVRKPGLGLLPN